MRKAERETIAILKKLENTMDDGMWLWAADGGIYLMRCKDKKGTHAMTPNGGVDPDYVIHWFLRIDADGGDWG